jgi:hypothetical protein
MIYGIQNQSKRWFHGYDWMTGRTIFGTKAWALFFSTRKAAQTALNRISAVDYVDCKYHDYTIKDVR